MQRSFRSSRTRLEKPDRIKEGNYEESSAGGKGIAKGLGNFAAGYILNTVATLKVGSIKRPRRRGDQEWITCTLTSRVLSNRRCCYFNSFLPMEYPKHVELCLESAFDDKFDSKLSKV